MKAKVKWFSDSKGYGFLDFNGKDVFIHYTAIECKGFKTLKQGEEVEIELYETEKGLEAKRARRVDSNY